MFALADANNFYASCETVFRPDLRGKPICVVSNNDGCVIARSAEAKRMGIKMGAPLFKNERYFRDNGVYTFSSNYALYGDMSARMMAILSEMAPGQEIYSIDESFLDVSGVAACLPLEEFGRQMRDRVRKELGLIIGVGFGSALPKRWPSWLTLRLNSGPGQTALSTSPALTGSAGCWPW